MLLVPALTSCNRESHKPFLSRLLLSGLWFYFFFLITAVENENRTFEVRIFTQVWKSSYEILYGIGSHIASQLFTCWVSGDKVSVVLKDYIS